MLRRRRACRRVAPVRLRRRGGRGCVLFQALEVRPPGMSTVIHREGLEDREDDDAGAAEVSLVKREARRRRMVAERVLRTLANETTAIVGVLPSRELLFKSLGWTRRAIRIADERAERHTIVDVFADMMSSCVGLWKKNRRRLEPTAAIVRKDREGLLGGYRKGAGRLVEASARRRSSATTVSLPSRPSDTLDVCRVRPGRPRSSVRPTR